MRHIKNRQQFINESKKPSPYDLKLKIASEVSYINYKYDRNRLFPIIYFRNGKVDDHEIYELYTHREPFVIHNILREFESTAKVYDRYERMVHDYDNLEYILECIRKYDKFLKINPKHELNENIANALSGSLKDEKDLFNALSFYKFKWDEFSDELINSLSEEEKKFLKSYTSGSKYNLFESKDETNWNKYLYKMKKMPAFSREKHSIGKGFWSWDPAWPKGSYDGIAVNEFGPVQYSGGGSEYSRLQDDNLIQELKDSIDFAYDYMFEQEEHNKLFQIVRSFIMNYRGSYEDSWNSLLQYLIEKDRIKAVERIYWDEDAIDGDIETIIRSAKGLSKYNI